MVDSSRAVDLRGLEWVIGWEVYGKEEDAALQKSASAVRELVTVLSV